jgi:PAS domain-containing protein
VFASDLHEHSLERARQGFYPAEIETDVGPERLRRFFTKEDGGYRIHKDVREIVLFAPHNLLSDPPFSRIDLISCRNLLIYLHRDAQEDVDGLFHYALRPDGYLVLGGSELATRSDLFAGEGKKSGVYRRRDVPTPESRLPVFLWWRNQNRGQEVTRITGVPQAYGRLHQRLVEQFAPPSVLVGPDDKVVHLSEHAGRYLVHPGGEVTSSVFKLVREELSIDLHAAVSEARRGRSTRSRPIQVRFNGQTRPVVLNVRPCSDPLETGFVLVIFDEVDVDQGSETEGDDRTPRTVGHDIRQRELETELDLLKQKLQAVIEEYDTSQEEMRAANEELQSANEELRSTMEELETGKEELHSMNEELQTVNQENRHKVEELSQLSGDLANLLASTDIATLFLDKELRIMRFTPKVAELFNMRVTDRGRLLSDLTHRLGYQELASDAGAVLGQLIPIQREVRDDAGRWYLARVLPYRSSTDRIEGVVITFVDVTADEAGRGGAAPDRRARVGGARGDGAVARSGRTPARLRGSRYGTRRGPPGVDRDHTHAEMGTVHLLDKQRALQVTAQRGFERSFQGYHRSAPDSDDFPWIRALDVGARVVIEDVESDPSDPGHRALAAMAGYRGVHSIPLVKPCWREARVLSTYHAQPHRPSERDLRILDLYARQATEFIEQVRTKEALNEKTRQLQEEDDRKGCSWPRSVTSCAIRSRCCFNSMQLVAQGTPSRSCTR